MKKFMTLAAACSLVVAGAAFAGKSPSPTQSQATGSVITTQSIYSAFASAGIPVDVVSTSANSAEVRIEVKANGQTVIVPATVTMGSNGNVTVTYADGSSDEISG